jgi:hypothetical protein
MILRDIDHRARGDYSRDLQPAEWGSVISLHGSNPESLMSALGQNATCARVEATSAFTSMSDIDQHLLMSA